MNVTGKMRFDGNNNHNASAHDPSASKTKINAVKPGKEYFVAPDGSDANPGTSARPFATLAKARDAVRALKGDGLPAGGVAVTLKNGEYPVTETFALTAEDGGTAASPVIYRAANKGKAILYGGARLTGFHPVTDASALARLPPESHGNVYQCDLKALGITDYSALHVRGFGQTFPKPNGDESSLNDLVNAGLTPSLPTLELYCDGRPQTLARWPNEGFVEPKRLPASGNPAAGMPSIIEYDGDRPARWMRAEDPWLFGYFKYLWADATIRVSSIDPAAKTITMVAGYQCHAGSAPGMDTRQGIIYYAFNLLEELDRPGEWYLDRRSGILYFWPPANPANVVIEIGMLSRPMLTMDDPTHVRVEGLVFDLARSDCMHINGGENCLIAACIIKRFAGNGVVILNGRGNGVYGCDIHDMGRHGIIAMGGDRKSLSPAGHYVENCSIHGVGRIDRTFVEPIRAIGVGIRVAHNLLYDCPSTAVNLSGNDHVVEYNEVHSAVQESDDQGAMSLFGNPTFRGVIFRYNRFHDNGNIGGKKTAVGQAAIRFDDTISGMLVHGNIFQRSSNGSMGAVHMNCGRDNMIENNIFDDCRRGVTGGWHPDNKFWAMIREGKAPPDFYVSALYLKRYPAIARMMDEPGVNHVRRNVFHDCGNVVLAKGQSALVMGDDVLLDKGHMDMFENGVFRNTNPGFVDVERGNFNLIPNAALFESVAFKPIPVDEIGLYADAYRATWPVHSTPVVMPDWRACVRPPLCGDAEFAPVWTVFAPLTRGFPPPSDAQLRQIPKILAANGREMAPVHIKPQDGGVDLAGVLDGTAPDKTAWIYIPFHTKTAGKTTLGFGADWWLQAWVDGAPVCDTVAIGNGARPISMADHVVVAELAPGAHLLVVRFISGKLSSMFAAGGAASVGRAWDVAHWWASSHDPLI